MTQDSYNPTGGRRGSPWWIWLLGGCGGCLLIVIVALVAGGFFVRNAVRDAMKSSGPVTAASVKQSMGDVPLYPNGQLNLEATRGAQVGARIASSFQPNGPIHGTAALDTQDSAETVMAYYQTELAPRGWSLKTSQSIMGQTQSQYMRGNEMLLVQVQPQRRPGKSGNVVVLMLSGPEAPKAAPAGTGAATGGG